MCEGVLLRQAIGILNTDIAGTIAYGVTTDWRVTGLQLDSEARDKTRSRVDNLFR